MTPLRVHLFHHTRLLATIHRRTATPDAIHTLDDGTVVRSIRHLTVLHADGTRGIDVQVVPTEPKQPSSALASLPRVRLHRA